MQPRTDIVRLNPITLGAVVAGLIVLVVTGEPSVFLWVALAATMGAGVGWVVHRVSERDADYPPVDERTGQEPDRASDDRPPGRFRKRAS